MAFDIKSNLKKNKGLWIFVGAALAVAVLLGLFVSPFASKSPDGLDKTAQEKGFSKKAEENKGAWANSPMADYAVPGVKSEKTSTGLSGLFGVVITLAVALLIGLAVYGFGRIWHKKNGDDTGTPISET